MKFLNRMPQPRIEFDFSAEGPREPGTNRIVVVDHDGRVGAAVTGWLAQVEGVRTGALGPFSIMPNNLIGGSTVWPDGAEETARTLEGLKVVQIPDDISSL
jgi:hypothetical protein